jgi:hypothetical protein
MTLRHQTLTCLARWRMVFVGNTFTRVGCKLWFSGGENVYEVVVNMWKNKCRYLKTWSTWHTSSICIPAVVSKKTIWRHYFRSDPHITECYAGGLLVNVLHYSIQAITVHESFESNWNLQVKVKYIALCFQTSCKLNVYIISLMFIANLFGLKYLHTKDIMPKGRINKMG